MGSRLLLGLVLFIGVGGFAFLFYETANAPDDPHREDAVIEDPSGGLPGLEPSLVHIHLPASQPAGLAAPSPELTPDEVVRTVVGALARNDSPSPQSGVSVAFNFASPSNRNATGPFHRFVLLVHSGQYLPLINHTAAEFGPVRVDNDRATRLVTVRDSFGQPAHYVFLLARHAAEGVSPLGPAGDPALDGCWLTEGVIRISPDEAAELRSSTIPSPTP